MRPHWYLYPSILDSGRTNMQRKDYNYNFPKLQSNTNNSKCRGNDNYNYLDSLSSEIESNEQVIIIKPLRLLNDSVEEPEDGVSLKKFFSNETTLARDLNKSPFAAYNIIDTYKNLAKDLLIVKISKISNDKLTALLKTEVIGTWKVSCRLPMQEETSRGVIGPIGIDTPEEDLKEALKVRDESIIIKDVKRIVKGKERTPTLSFIVTFEGRVMPEYVYLYHQRYKVSAFVGEPWRCFNCQGFGHNANGCRAKSKCVVCAGPHTLKNCPSKISDERIVAKCANCGGEHSANCGGFPNMKLAKVVEHVRSKQRLSYKDALQAVKQKEVEHSAINREPQYRPNERYNYNTVSTPNYAIKGKSTRPNANSVATSTAIMKDAECQTEQLSNINSQDTLIKMSVMMIKLLKINNEIDINKNPAKGLEILIKMLGITVKQDQLENIIDKEFNTHEDDTDCTYNATEEPKQNKKHKSDKKTKGMQLGNKY